MTPRPEPSTGDDPPAWRVAVDTGGTFTDAVVLAPDGARHTVKVLSSARLRAAVLASEPAGGGAFRVSIDAPWLDAPASASVAIGMRAHADAESWTVREAEARAVTLAPDSDRPSPPAPGSVLEFAGDDTAPVLAARIAIGVPGRLGAPPPLPPIEWRLATTRGTNTLLERRGEPVLLCVTRGFADLLDLGDMARPDLFARVIERPPPLHAEVIEADERLDAQGGVVRPLDTEALARAAANARARGIGCAAVALLHAWRDDRHERAAERVLLESGFRSVCRSADLAPMQRIVPRARTAVVDAYLDRAVGAFLREVSAQAGPGSRATRVRVMTSAGGLCPAPAFRAKDSLLSGPAGGVIGAVAAAKRHRLGPVIAFDMGGTSTDVSRIDDPDAGPPLRYEHRVGDAELLAPAVAIETVAAGGGSICGVRDGALHVGPESAGADPGPACYGRGGPLTLTDVNLLLDRLDPERFALPLDRPAAERAARDLHQRWRGRAPASDEDLHALCAALAAIGDEAMADAIRRVSVRWGRDPSGYTLLCFGGAGGQHACAIAARLAMRRVCVPPEQSVLSAVGLESAALERVALRQVLRPLDETTSPAAIAAELEREAARALEADGVTPRRHRTRVREAALRFAGQTATLPVPIGKGPDADEALRPAFKSAYRAVYGYDPPDRPLEIESVRVVVDERPRQTPAPPEPAPGRAHAGARIERSSMAPGDTADGPTLIVEDQSVTRVPDGWRARVDGAGALLIEATRDADDDAPDEARSELLEHRLTSLAEEMGALLARTALSVNVKDRRDYSCALLDAEGRLVVNAPHVPVHLGALGVCVRRLAETTPMAPGTVVLTNHPAFGGSHLPDLTLVAPAHDDAGRLLGYAAVRAHHAEIGGARPGSLHPGARTLAEEGVVLAPFTLVPGPGAPPAWETLRARLAAPPYPSRRVEENLADLAAQLAATRYGVEGLRDRARALGTEALALGMTAINDRAEAAARRALRHRPDLDTTIEEALDDGGRVRARLRVRDGTLDIDFGGTDGGAPGGLHPGALNATGAIVRAVALYVVRLMLDEPAPLNEGLLAPVTLRGVRGMLDPWAEGDPNPEPPVGGGNVETSQRLADLLVRGLGLAAAGHGSMNNLIIGGEGFSSYETIGGGAGAAYDARGRARDGASGVQTHMTNTRAADPEIDETRLPIRVERLALRRGSGGAGTEARGGDGIEKVIHFLAPARVALLTQRREAGAPGAEGGEPGTPGEQTLHRAHLTEGDEGGGGGEPLEALSEFEAAPGDRLCIRTPGGGGLGCPQPGIRENGRTGVTPG